MDTLSGVCVSVWGGGGGGDWVTLFKLILSPAEKGSTSKGKKFAPPLSLSTRVEIDCLQSLSTKRLFL